MRSELRDLWRVWFWLPRDCGVCSVPAFERKERPVLRVNRLFAKKHPIGICHALRHSGAVSAGLSLVCLRLICPNL